MSNFGKSTSLKVPKAGHEVALGGIKPLDETKEGSDDHLVGVRAEKYLQLATVTRKGWPCVSSRLLDTH